MRVRTGRFLRSLKGHQNGGSVGAQGGSSLAPPATPNEDVYTVQRAAERLGVTGNTVVRWIERGLLKASQIKSGAPWRVQVTESDRQRLTAGDAPQGWLPLKGAAQALGVSQQTVVDKLQRGELEAVRVQVGARTAWRIQVDSVPSDIQMTLFD